MLSFFKKITPKPIFEFFQPAYHLLWPLLGAIIFRFPSRKIKIVGVTGTKGKTSTTEFINAILEASGQKTAVLNTIRFKIGDNSRPNLFKMSMPGRLFIQKFIADAVNAECDWVVMETTSEGMRQFRHLYIDFDAGIFTGLEPEHIESHGSFENYLNAKLKLPKALAKSKKRPRVMIANCDSEYGEKFLQFDAEKKIEFHLVDTNLKPEIPGEFMVLNAGLAETFAKTQNISSEIIALGVASLKSIPGRVKFVKINEKQSFDVVVDYAHTPGSLEALYKAFPSQNKIGVLGNTGGGRDTWKRPIMGEIASKYCNEVILTNEDPYDENPNQIIKEMTVNMLKNPTIIMNRREALRFAFEKAQRLSQDDKNKVVVLITGKGTDPYIMEANEKKTPWSDENVAREELEKILK
ncbi:MAG: Mur ligase family protein [Minisyncoccia bacterium]